MPLSPPDGFLAAHCPLKCFGCRCKCILCFSVVDVDFERFLLRLQIVDNAEQKVGKRILSAGAGGPLEPRELGMHPIERTTDERTNERNA